jgi:hypothetical protein
VFHPLSEKQLRAAMMLLLDDPTVRAAVEAMPEAMRGELDGGDLNFLHGVFVGATKGLAIAARMDEGLRKGDLREALQLKAMMDAALLIICKRLVKKESRIVTLDD